MKIAKEKIDSIIALISRICYTIIENKIFTHTLFTLPFHHSLNTQPSPYPFPSSSPFSSPFPLPSLLPPPPRPVTPACRQTHLLPREVLQLHGQALGSRLEQLPALLQSVWQELGLQLFMTFLQLCGGGQRGSQVRCQFGTPVLVENRMTSVSNSGLRGQHFGF